jgi:glutamate-5-semialdehyde dehydrogenase
MKKIGIKAKNAANQLVSCSPCLKDQVLIETAREVMENKKSILIANGKDIKQAKKKNLSNAMIDRLLLNDERLISITDSLKLIAALPDPVGKVLKEFNRPNGLNIKRVSTPIGVIGVIFESRPNVLIDAGALCLKAGNTSILRCGSESVDTSTALHKCFTKALALVGLSDSCIQLIPTQDRSAVKYLLAMSEFVDVIVPRGGKSLVALVQKEARVPVFAHLDGIVHIYVNEDADPEIATEVILNSKTRRPGICGAVECLLIDKKFIEKNGPSFLTDLVNAGVDVRVDRSLKNIHGTTFATKDDWGKEFLDMIIAVRSVNDIDDAISHIKHYGSGHTDCIITKNDDLANKFFSSLDSAILMRNASTQFADGGEFGFGAEIGIATGKLHARGPVGLEQLTTFKYLVEGNGTVRS